MSDFNADNFAKKYKAMLKKSNNERKKSPKHKSNKSPKRRLSPFNCGSSDGGSPKRNSPFAVGHQKSSPFAVSHRANTSL